MSMELRPVKFMLYVKYTQGDPETSTLMEM